MNTETLQARAARLVQNEVLCCVSSLVSTLAQGYGAGVQLPREVVELHEQAFELASPVPDYEEAARDLGYDIRHDMHGFYACTTDEADHEDDGNTSAGFDGRAHFATIEDAARSICEENDQAPYDREVFEHWAVSTWLADKLIEKGEKVDKDFAGLNVWARTTTGQAISIDWVIEQITQELHA